MHFWIFALVKEIVASSTIWKKTSWTDLEEKWKVLFWTCVTEWWWIWNSGLKLYKHVRTVSLSVCLKSFLRTGTFLVPGSVSSKNICEMSKWKQRYTWREDRHFYWRSIQALECGLQVGWCGLHLLSLYITLSLSKMSNYVVTLCRKK